MPSTTTHAPHHHRPSACSCAACRARLQTTPHSPTGERQEEDSIPLRQRAFTLYCQGHRSPAIAARLNVPERTIRAWISADLRALANESAAQTRHELLQLAIARQLAIATAAWDAYAQLPTPLQDEKGSRYLRLAHAAYREIDRLQGLYLPAPAEQPQEVRIILERIPNDEATHTPASFHGPNSAPPVGERPGEGYPESPAETATPLTSNAAVAATSASASAVSVVSARSVVPTPDSPAETATLSMPSVSSVVSASGPGALWPRYGPGEPLPRHIADALGLPRFRERNRRPARPLPPPLFASRL